MNPSVGWSVLDQYLPVQTYIPTPAGAGSEEGHKNDLRDGAPLLGGKAERVGTVEPGEEKAPGRPYGGLSVLKGGL